MVTIKTISKCFKEVKRLTGDLLSDSQVNQILDEAKIKLNENAYQQQQGKTDEILAQEIINNFEYEQALKKRNLAENNIKALDTYQKIIDAVESVRTKNNKNWMDILRVAFTYAPKKTAKIMASIYRDDSKISNLAKKLTK